MAACSGPVVCKKAVHNEIQFHANKLTVSSAGKPITLDYNHLALAAHQYALHRLMESYSYGPIWSANPPRLNDIAVRFTVPRRTTCVSRRIINASIS
jgi:hypothetical protein